MAVMKIGKLSVLRKSILMQNESELRESLKAINNIMKWDSKNREIEFYEEDSILAESIANKILNRIRLDNIQILNEETHSYETTDKIFKKIRKH